MCRKKPPPSQDNLLTQITFHSYLIVLVSHTDKLLARLAEPCKGPPHEFSDSVETCQYPFLYLTKQPQRGKLWCKAHLFRKAAPFASGLPWMKHDLQFPHLNPSNILCSLLVSLPFSSAWEKARSSQSPSKDAYSRLCIYMLSWRCHEIHLRVLLVGFLLHHTFVQKLGFDKNTVSKVFQSISGT